MIYKSILLSQMTTLVPSHQNSFEEHLIITRPSLPDYHIMRSPTLASGLALLTFILPAFAVNLRPFRISHYEAAFGIQRRSYEFHSDLEPKGQVELFWGEGNDDGTLAVANITLTAPAGLPIVLLERFESLTKYVDCNGDDGHMSLTFKSEDAFQRSLQAWAFVNHGEHHRFMVIANHDGCGRDHQRQPYM